MAKQSWVIIDDDSVEHEFEATDPETAIEEWLATAYAPERLPRMSVRLAGDISVYNDIDAPDADRITCSSWWVLDKRAPSNPGAPFAPHPPGAHGKVMLAGPLPDPTNERVRCRLGLLHPDICCCDGGCIAPNPTRDTATHAGISLD